MHKTIRLTTAGAAIAAAFALTAAAQAATTTGDATAEILEAIQVSETADLDFAQIAVNAAGTVVVSTGATIVDQCTGGLICAGTKARGAFLVEGAAGISVTASVTDASIPLDGPGVDMTVDNFTVYFPDGDVLDTNGEATFQVGGTLHVADGQAPGVYTGIYNVEVAYD